MALDNLIDNLVAEGLNPYQRRVHVLLGYSGGSDSTALLHLLKELQGVSHLQVTAAYVDHRWRGTPPPELPLVHKNTEACEVPLVIIPTEGEVTEASKTEAVAREHRYKRLSELAIDLGCDAVLTAHHADDQVETILFRILRGTGMDGLIGIHKNRTAQDERGQSVPIVRPLLNIPKQAVQQYIADKKLTVFEDPSNDDIVYKRNYIRQKIMPVLETYNPNVKNALYKLALVMNGDSDIVHDVVEELWQDIYKTDERGGYLDSIKLTQLGLPYQRRMIKQFLMKNGLSVDFELIEDALAFVRGETRRKLTSALMSVESDGDPHTISGDSEADISGENKRFLALYKDKIRLVTARRPVIDDPIDVSATGRYVVPTLNLTLHTTVLTEQPKPGKVLPVVKPDPDDPDSRVQQEFYLDLTKILEAQKNAPVVLRTRQSGDKFHPPGMPIPMRLKKVFINQGIPRFERDTIPVLAVGSDVIWVMGLGVSASALVLPEGRPTHRFGLTMANADLADEVSVQNNIGVNALPESSKEKIG